MAKLAPQSAVSAQRARMFKLMYASPITGLTPTKLVSWLNAFSRGELRQAVLLWQQILERDDQIGPCADKRTRAVASLPWQILPVDDSPAAQKHKQALEHFYNNLSAFDGLNEMERGGVRQLVKQMMTAIGMRYAMHEIIWKPAHPGGLTAELKFLPLQFFENTTGRLRYLETDTALEGRDLDEFFGPGNWLCNCGRGLMFASSVAYIFKTPNGLKAWVTYVEKFGIPGIHATTDAAKDSPEWDALVEAVAGFGEDLALVTNTGAKITPIDNKAGGSSAHKDLVDRMDRGISRIWMGGDLATMSAGNQAVGSMPQVDDLDILREDDAQMITDALNEYVDTQVICQRFGPAAAPLAYFQLVVPKKKTTDETVKKIETAAKYGVPVSQAYVRQELNLPEPKPEEALVTAAPAVPAALAPFRASNEQPSAASAGMREQLVRNFAGAEILRAKAATFAPIISRLQEIAGIEDDTAQDAALLKLQADLPRLARDLGASAEEIAAWEKMLATALVSAAAEGRAELQPASNR